MLLVLKIKTGYFDFFKDSTDEEIEDEDLEDEQEEEMSQDVEEEEEGEFESQGSFKSSSKWVHRVFAKYFGEGA